MKKMFFVLIASLVFISAKAQPGTTVRVINNWQCDALINVVAVCPDDGCTQHSSQTMSFFPYAPNWPGYIYPQSWLPAPPPCSNWVWDFAQIDFACADGSAVYFTQVGNASSPCNVNNNYYAFTIPQDCADACFGGKTLVQISWSVAANGDILITIW